MESTTPAVASALLQWVNSFELSPKPSSWKDLEDGQLLWSILHDVDPDYFDGSLPELERRPSDGWIPRWQNLKHVDRMVTTYIRDTCGQLPVLTRKMNPDMKAIAEGGSLENTTKLVKLVLLAACYSEKSNQRIVTMMLSKLGPTVASTLAEVIKEIEALDSRMAEYGVDPEISEENDQPTAPQGRPRGSSFERDLELEHEEQMIRVMQEKKQLEEQIERLKEDLADSKEIVGKLEQDLEEARTEQRRKGKYDDMEFEQMNTKNMQDRDYIAEMESDLAHWKATADNQERQLQKLKADEETKQELRDELQLIKNERDGLAQKAKASENLKKKIESLQDQARLAETLKERLQEADDQLAEVDHLRDRCTALQKANEENVEAISNGEQAIFDQKTARRRLEHDIKILMQQRDQAHELQERAHETVRELEEKVRELEIGQSQGGQGLNNLDNELSPVQELLHDEVSKSGVINADAILLRQRVELLQSRCNKLEEQYLDTYQENLGLQDAIKDGKDKQQTEENPFMHQTEKLHRTEEELAETKKKFIASTTQITELKHRLASAESSAPVNGEAKIDTEALIDNQERQKYVEEVDSELEKYKSLLRHALFNREALQKEPVELRKQREFEVIKELLQNVRSAEGGEADTIIDDAATYIVTKITEAQVPVANEKANAEQAATIENLKRELEQAKKAVPLQPQDSAAQQDITNLQRENKLLTSAWYDLASRMQSNTVALQRRSEPPKSWLGRQRLAVSGGRR
ncbi:hypothetical protein K402DRAFT_417459 [Aulographum hederae CBS 113979]|uniref:HOOK N-terminal domain-containing protein n=1 Tax=Aulographum hederae CBS 113979 TaxID=1176131 RepID=A0A6G1HCB7_9PEZI|nr:hypothetical protein K402DRAFT_417459 [Aulographum hederae CBS 113979]